MQNISGIITYIKLRLTLFDASLLQHDMHAMTPMNTPHITNSAPIVPVYIVHGISSQPNTRNPGTASLQQYLVTFSRIRIAVILNISKQQYIHKLHINEHRKNFQDWKTRIAVKLELAHVHFYNDIYRHILQNLYTVMALKEETISFIIMGLQSLNSNKAWATKGCNCVIIKVTSLNGVISLPVNKYRLSKQYL